MSEITKEATLTVGAIMQNDYDWGVLALESIESIANEIVIIDGGSTEEELAKLDKYVDGREKFKVIHNKYPGNNGTQYNQILKYATSDWVLMLDADEVVDDNAHLLLEHIRTGDKSVYSIRMNHLIWTFGMMDATEGGSPKFNPDFNHYVNRRLFKRKDGIYWDSHEHGLIQGFTDEEHGLINDVIVWHFGKAKSMMDLKNKYEMNLKRSKIHSKEFLDWWYKSLLFGLYPVKKLVNADDLPSVIKREFYI